MKKVLLLLVLLVLVPSVLLAQHRVEVYCPDMLVAKRGVGHWEAEKLVGEGRVFLPGNKLLFREFIIPATPVFGIGRWRAVEPCVQFGYSDNMDQMHLKLPREPVRFGVALEMVAVGTLTLHTGEEYDLVVTYPDCRTRPVPWSLGRLRVAEALTAVGTATKR